MSPTAADGLVYFSNPRGFYSLASGPSMAMDIGGFTSGTNLLEREYLLSVVQNITPDSTPLLNRLRLGSRNRYIEDNNGICMCYKHRRIWMQGADFKKGRRPYNKSGGACKECVLKTI